MNDIKMTWKSRISLRNVVVGSVFLTATILVLITASLLVNRFNKTITNSAIIKTQQSVNNVSSSVGISLEANISAIESVKKTIINSGNISLQEKGYAMFTLRDDIIAAMIYDAEGTIIDYYSKERYTLKESYKTNNQSNFCNEDFLTYHVSRPHINNLFPKYYPWVITLTTRIHIDDIPYYIALDFEFSEIARYIDTVSIGERGYSYLADKNGYVIYHPQQQLIYSKLKEENTAQMKKSIYYGVIATDSYIYASVYLGVSDWYIVGVSYIDELINDNKEEFFYSILVILGIAILLSILLSFILARRFTTPVNKLLSAMANFEMNVENYKIQSINGFYEVETLNKSFDHMAKRIKILMEKIVLEEKEIRKVELKALQNQINPHFLYNTLDSILWMCQKNGNTEASEMVSALAKLFRISISKGKDLITIEEELTHVTNYLIIQKIRYKNHFNYLIEVDEEIRQHKCLNIILQPFVENSIYHGIDRMVDEGLIKIVGKKRKDSIELKVIDNGLGMTEEKVANLFNEKNQKAGVGVKNVHSRIQIYFGNQYGIEVKSELDVGTEIIITIPILGDSNEK